MDKSKKIRIKFELTDEFGNDYNSESLVDIADSLGERTIDAIGEQFNIFLKQCGYVRKNDYIFMEDITGEEYDEISNFLDNLRNGGDLNDN